MKNVNLSGECVDNGDGSCTLNIRPVEGSSCGCATVSITLHCGESCCSGSDCC
ncbi:hypothetical protein KDL29_11110 [bacterium]|nr:hypothetical protein [bacterium]